MVYGEEKERSWSYAQDKDGASTRRMTDTLSLSLSVFVGATGKKIRDAAKWIQLMLLSVYLSGS